MIYFDETGKNMKNNRNFGYYSKMIASGSILGGEKIVNVTTDKK